MPVHEHDIELARGALAGDYDAVATALGAGADVNGRPEQPCAPIVGATLVNDSDMVEFLLGQGADPDKPVIKKMPFPGLGIEGLKLGERALHVAARSGNVEIVRLLLDLAGANPNVADRRGRTPLMATYKSSHDFRVEVVRLLLQAGADPTLADKNGTIPFILVAFNGDLELIDMLYTSAPATLNFRCPSTGQTPLFLACAEGNEDMVSKLLSLGAIESVPVNDYTMCPLAMAAIKGREGVVRVLLNEGGVRAVGGEGALPKALCMAVRCRRAGIVRLLLVAVGGEKRRSEWANSRFSGRTLLHHGAASCCSAEVSILLEAGADAAALDSKGRIPIDIIGVDLGQDGGPQMDQGEELATRQMLQRGPTYRARSCEAGTPSSVPVVAVIVTLVLLVMLEWPSGVPAVAVIVTLVLLVLLVPRLLQS